MVRGCHLTSLRITTISGQILLKFMGVICMIINALKKLIVDPDEEPCINFQSKEFKLASGRVINARKGKK